MLIVAALGAGVLTTLAGMGGGTVLVLLVLLTVDDPVTALAATSMRLLVGNLHRVLLFRQRVDWTLLRPFALGAVPAAMAAGWLVPSLPDSIVKALIGVVALVAVIGILFGVRIRPAAGAATTVGGVVGAVSATTGGGGLLAGPFFLASGLTGERYIATGACAALAVHIGRIVGYGGGGGLTRETVLLGMGFAVAIPLGNLVGKRIRPMISTRNGRRLEVGTAASLAVLAVANAM